MTLSIVLTSGLLDAKYSYAMHVATFERIFLTFNIPVISLTQKYFDIPNNSVCFVSIHTD